MPEAFVSEEPLHVEVEVCDVAAERAARKAKVPAVPPASSEAVRHSMQGNRSKNTKPELLVRQRLVEHHRLSAGRLNAEKVKYVSARAQFREEQLLEPLFTEDELAVFKRGRNASKASVAKHASPEEYRASTGFECLLGWLYLTGQMPRVEELFEKLWADFDPNQK